MYVDSDSDGDVGIGTPTSPGPEFLLSNTGDLTITGSFVWGRPR
ncbi:hypothetical protein C357_12344 [Citreicella sp. 357]|nr:hypothetical protein C357_12344 [Citreicella sp. 357]